MMDVNLATASANHNSVLTALDDSKLSRFHWKAMITSGMGFFTDAYDLFIIGVVLAVLTPIWHLSSFEISLIGSTSLIAAALGSVVLGRLADFIGRRAIYGYTLIVLAIGALASAFSPNVVWLIVFRFILGLGIGGDYPLSATLMSEYANRRDRGKLITMVFSMQGAGLILGPLVAIALLAAGINQDFTWRIMLAFGAIPALATFYLRRQIAETPRFAMMVQGDAQAAASAVDKALQNGHNGRAAKAAQNGHARRALKQVPTAKQNGTAAKKRSSLALLFTPRYLRWLIGAAGAWFLLDIAYYGTTISSPLVLKALNAHSNLLLNTVFTLLIFLVAALPGYIIAAFTIDRLGRKWIQCVGFAMMALSYGLLAVFPALTTITLPFLLLYGLSYLFTEFGPNVTTFVYPAEIFPVTVRSSAHGLAAALGKVGAFIGAFMFPFLLNTIHLPGAMGVAAVISGAGLLLTLFTLPEPNQRSLEEISGEYALVEAEQPEAVQPVKQKVLAG